MSNIPGIQEYYNGKNIFITGGTGFLGKVLIEKLLRSCTGINKIYLLIRSKKGVSSNQRLQNLLHSKIFSIELKINEIEDKIVAIEGDLTKEGMGLSELDRKLLTENLSVVFHVAGDVKFNEPIKDAVSHNLKGTKNVMDLVKECRHIETFVHVSTTYTFCHLKEYEEKVYPMKISPEDMFKACETMSEDELESYARTLLEDRPNSYTFVKALAEHLIHNEKPKSVPVSIVRPSIVFPCYEEPAPGWMDVFQGPSFLVTFGALGIMRTLDMEGNVLPSIIPVDMFCNGMIATAWYSATHRPKEVVIYNMTTEPHNSISFYDMIELTRAEQFNSPSVNAIRPYPPVPRTRPSRINLFITVFFAHTLFSYLVDTLSRIAGTVPKMVGLTEKMHKGCHHFVYFWNREWSFKTNNTRNLIKIIKNQSKLEWETFKFDPDDIDYNHLCKYLWIGIRKNLLKEPDENIPEAKLRYIKVTYGYRTLLIIWYTMLLYLFYMALSWPISHYNLGIALNP